MGNKHLGAVVLGLAVGLTTGGTGLLPVSWAVAAGASTAYAVEACYHKPSYSTK